MTSYDVSAPDTEVLALPDSVLQSPVALRLALPAPPLPQPQRSWRARVVQRGRTIVLAADLAGLLLPALFLQSGRLAVVALAVLSVLFLHSGGLYRQRLHLSVLDDLPQLLVRTMTAAALVGAAVQLLLLPPGLTDFLRIALVGFGCQVVLRLVAHRVMWFLRRQGRVPSRTLVLGAGHIGRLVASTLVAQPQYGLSPVGFVDDDPLKVVGPPTLPTLGSLADLPDVIARHDVSVLVVAFGRHTEADLVDVVRGSEHGGCDVFVVPRLFEAYGAATTSHDHIGAVPVVRVRRQRFNPAAWALKRVFDVVSAGTALLLLSPLMAVIALAVRHEGGKGVLFRQVRVGLDSRTFELLKFRSLKPVDETESATNWNVAHDTRLGPVGKFLRRTSLDELPQLWNVLRGEMTIVGPRPERPHFVEVFARDNPGYLHRHRVPAGLTGLAQVSGLRGDTSIADRARYDNYYIEHWSLWLDMKIIVRTVREVLRGGGR